MRLKTITDEQLLEAAKTNHSYAALMRALHIKFSEGNWGSLKIRVATLNIDTSQWKGQRHGRGGMFGQAKPLLFGPNIFLHCPDRFKKRLIAEGI